MASSAESQPIFTNLLDLQSLYTSVVAGEIATGPGLVSALAGKPVLGVAWCSSITRCSDGFSCGDCCVAAWKSMFNASLPLETTVLIMELAKSGIWFWLS